MQVFKLLLILIIFQLVSINPILSQQNKVSESFFQDDLSVVISNDTFNDTISIFDIVRGKDKQSFVIDQKGDTLNYKTFENKVVLIDYWFLKCKPCIAEITGFHMLQAKFKDEPFMVLSLTFDQNELVREKLLSKKDFNYSIVTDARPLQRFTYPLKILFDKRGNIYHVGNVGSTASNAHLLLVNKFTPMIKKLIHQ